ncbi:MAG: YifB family Mg chelatase-like AAA ATPase [Bacteroides sp.]
MLVKTFGSAVHGISAQTIVIEVVTTQGIRLNLVGLPDNAVKESEHRIRSAFATNGYTFPRRAIVINMAPADLRKEGSAYDLPLAIGILAASEQLPDEKLDQYIIMGELSLDGNLQPIRGVLPIALQARESGFKGLIIPTQNAPEAAVVDGLEIYAAENLQQVVSFFNGDENAIPRIERDTKADFEESGNCYDIDFADVRGQEGVKRAFEIAAAGGHNLIMIGPPGAGKTMLAKRLSTILPPLTLREALETTKIHSVVGLIPLGAGIVTVRPFRSPHHTISDVALVGGGQYPQPGEISLAHNGVLFLDELPEFRRQVLEVMRQPLEDRKITLSRARSSAEYPAAFMLIASMNPCPCGYYNHPTKECVCTPAMVQKYLNKISGPLLDRIDLHVEVVPVPFEKLAQNTKTESSAEIRKRVIAARERQAERFANKGIYCNAQMGSQQLQQYCKLSEDCLSLLRTAMQRFSLSARAYDRILKVARTIADLDQKENIESAHIGEAIQYRALDKEAWGSN